MFDGQGIGNAVYGMQRLVDCPETRDLVRALALKVTTKRSFELFSCAAVFSVTAADFRSFLDNS